MALSLNDLIDFILSEVALCGQQGASTSDVLKFIDEFYANVDNNAPVHIHAQVINRPFQEKVWTWLTRNVEVSVGKDREGNSLTLSEAEVIHQQQLKNGAALLDTIADGSVSNDHLSKLKSSTCSPRVHVSLERTWLAITGHEPDDTKVFPTEFELLSIIASRKGEGIVQTDLIALSGQDKRSVPKRTDLLQQKGYIQKRPVQIKSTRTSLCTLKKFVKPTPTYNTMATPAERGKKKTHQPDDIMDFGVLIGKLFEVLRDHKIIAREDIKSILGFADAWRWKILSRTLRKFERLGCLKRVRAPSQYSDTTKTLHSCVMFIRDPTKNDLERFDENLALPSSDIAQDNTLDVLEDDLEPMSIVPPFLEIDKAGQPIVKQDIFQESGRIYPRWTPDRCIHNQIFDIVHGAGTCGITHPEITKIGFGCFYRRPLENVLTRLVDRWQLPQLSHLRHLAMVRDIGLNKTVIHYIHYSAENFGKLVDSGSKDWAAVNSTSQQIEVVEPTLDSYGFPQVESLPAILEGGQASLFQCVAAVKPRDYRLSNSDPKAVKLEDGTYSVMYRKRPENKIGLISTPGRSDVGTAKTSLIPHKRTNDQIDHGTDQSRRLPKKFSKKDPSTYAGMAEKDYLEALGLDETWTEYNVFLIRRDKPGIYLTPRGKKRPTGKRQGRPKISRIAIVKSKRLRELAWFVEDASPNRDVVESMLLTQDGEGAAGNISFQTPCPLVEDHLQRPDGTKRKQRAESQPPTIRSEDCLDQENLPENSEPPAKRLRLQPESSELVQNDTVISDTLGESDHNEEGAQTDSYQPREGTTENNISLPISESERNVIIVNEGNVADESIEATPVLSPNLERAVSPLGSKSLSPGLSEATVQPDELGGGTSRKSRKKAFEIGGSVAVLRRKIVQDIVDSCGGVYPFGTELWYPFTTAWFKTKGNERPDLRTIKSTVKYMVDSGQLRQLTFSGKDRKGIMVTKRLITRPDISPDDPKVKDMQQKILSCSGRFYIPSDAEVDPKLSKTLKGPLDRSLPVDIDRRVAPGVVVQLMEKPAAVLAKERRIGRMGSRLLSNESRPGLSTPPSGVIRLRKFNPPSPFTDRLLATGAISSQSNFLASLQSGLVREPVYTAKLLSKRSRPPRFLVRALAPFRMLMNPLQCFHPSTGTFSSGGVGLSSKKSHPLATKLQFRLPVSLEDILITANFDQDYSDKFDVRSSRFFHRTDTISKWEIQNPDLFDITSPDLVFIHQNVEGEFEKAPAEARRFSFIHEDGRSQPPSKPHVVTRRRARSMVPPLRNLSSIRSISPNQIPAWYPPRGEVPPLIPMVPIPATVATSSAKVIPSRQFINRPINRRNRPPKPLPQDIMRKLLCAMVVVRTLAGGLEGKNIDWGIVASLFPEYDPHHIQDQGKNILNKNRLQMAKMQSDFQIAFLEAYDKGLVPSIDYNNLEAYEWGFVVAWADSNMGVLATSDNTVSLPATRKQFENLFEVREEEVIPELAEIYQYNSTITQAKRRILYASKGFSIPLMSLSSSSSPLKRKVNVHADSDRLKVARSWIRANALTPEESYDGQRAKQALLRLGGEPLLATALQSLIVDRSLTPVNKGRPTPGRHHAVTEYFSTILNRKRAIDSSVLKRAVYFKTKILDCNFRREGGFAEIKYDAEDGDILAAINLVATGQAVFTPRNPPRERFGLTVGGYQTRAIEKEKLRFAVDIRPYPETYQFGNPIEDRIRSIAPPRGDMDLGLDSLATAASTLPGSIPLWFDINCQFMEPWWEQAVGSIVGLVAIRPGINAADLAYMVTPTMGIWDVKLVLEWLVKADVIEPTTSSARLDGGRILDQGSWKVKEWWWMVCG